MNPFVQSVIETAIAAVGTLGLAGIIVTWRLLAGRQKLRQRELELEERRLDLEEQRLRLVLDDRLRESYERLPR